MTYIIIAILIGILIFVCQIPNVKTNIHEDIESKFGKR